MAVAHQLLTIIFHVIGDGSVYKELGAAYYDRQNKPKVMRKLVERLQKLGYYVTLQPIEERVEIPSPEVPKPQPRRRGRPCKCAERGIQCKHQRVSPTAINSMQNSWQSEGAEGVCS